MGNLLWTTSGVPIAVGSATESFHEIVSDGNGGVIVAWQRLPSVPGQTDIYAQKVDSSGTVQWTTNGVAVCLANEIQSFPKLVDDGNGGAIIVWDDSRAGPGNRPDVKMAREKIAGPARPVKAIAPHGPDADDDDRGYSCRDPGAACRDGATAAGPARRTERTPSGSGGSRPVAGL